MAIVFTAWQSDGPPGAHSELAHIRSDSKEWFKKSQEFLEFWKTQKQCTLITKDRTDHQSAWEHILFERVQK